MPEGTGLRWYQTWWGIVLAGMCALVVVVVIIFAVLTGIYWRRIKQGGGSALQQAFYPGFDQSIRGSVATGPMDRSKLETLDDPFLGTPGAPITIVEFVDFKCPNCRAVEPIIQKVASRYHDKVKIIMRDFPAESIHPGATQLAQIAFCANRQGRYWPLHTYFFANQQASVQTVTTAELTKLASTLGIDLSELQQCMASSQTTAEVNKDYVDGYSFGVQGTPTFFINGQKIQGVVPFEAWKEIIENFN